MIKRFAFIFTFLISIASFSQEKDEVADFFNKYLTYKSQMEMIEKSIPTLEECKLVFIGDNAKTYHDAIQTVKAEIKRIKVEIPNESFVKSIYEEFNSDDAKANDKKTTFGMHRIAKRLKPGIQFYMVSYLDKTGTQSRLSPFKFFVKLNEKWLFFAKPTKVFTD